MKLPGSSRHAAEHSAAAHSAILQPSGSDLMRVGSRRWMLQCGLAGIAGLSTVDLLRARVAAGQNRPPHKSVILFWLSGGPSQFEFWDPKPDAPAEIRGPWATIPTKVPGLRFGEHLPLMASIADRLAVLRGVDCRASDDHRAAVMQTGHSLALKDLKVTPAGTLKGRYPAMGSIAAKFRGANDPELPAFVGLGDPSISLWASDIWSAGELGSAYEPIAETAVAGRLELPAGINVARAQNRAELRRQFDCLQRDLDSGQQMQRMDRQQTQALEMVLSGKARSAFDIGREAEQARNAYGRDSFGEKALLARRLVESGVTFVVISAVFGKFDNHGDDVVWGGLEKGLKPLMPSVDRSLHALITDLESRGLLESTQIIAMGEFGRAPQMTPTGGRTHWTNCMSALVAGGAARGQVIGSTDERGYDVKDGRVIPADIAATIFKHLEIDLDQQWTDGQGRPHPIVADGGRPIADLVC